MSFYQGSKVPLSGGSARRSSGGGGIFSRPTFGAGSSLPRHRSLGDVYRVSSSVPFQGRSREREGFFSRVLSSLRKESIPKEKTQATSWKRTSFGTPNQVQPERPVANIVGGFYRLHPPDRGRWAEAQMKVGGSGERRWKMPSPVVTPDARRWALRAAALAVLTATSVALHGRVVEGLQDLAGFKLDQVKVSGTRYLSEGDVRSAAALKPGEGMFQLDLKAAAERVGRLPWVEKVFLERRLPQGILISVEERTPAALLDAGSVWGVDREGRLLPPASALLNEDLPLLSGVSVRPEDAGNTRAAEALLPALDFLAYLKKEDSALYADVSEVHLSGSDDLRVTFLDGTTARFGFDVGEDELRHMASVLSDLSAKGTRAALLDFRFKDQVVVRMR